MAHDTAPPSTKSVASSVSSPASSASRMPPRRSSFPAPSLEPKVKGVAFRTIDLCYERLRGAEARHRARDFMPPELAEAFNYHTLLAASWYPISWYRATFRAFRAASNDGPELARDVGRLAVRHDMSSVHKQILVKLISPQALLSMSQRVFNNYYDTGRFDIIQAEPNHVHARCGNCVGWDHNMWMELAGSCETLLQMAGARYVDLKIVSGGFDGHPYAMFEASWQ